MLSFMFTRNEWYCKYPWRGWGWVRVVAPNFKPCYKYKSEKNLVDYFFNCLVIISVLIVASEWAGGCGSSSNASSGTQSDTSKKSSTFLAFVTRYLIQFCTPLSRQVHGDAKYRPLPERCTIAHERLHTRLKSPRRAIHFTPKQSKAL